MNEVSLHKDDVEIIAAWIQKYPESDYITISVDSYSGIGSIVKASLTTVINGDAVTVTKTVVPGMVKFADFLESFTIAEKLKLAEEAGIVLPHHTNTDNPVDFPVSEQSLVYRLRKRAEIRRQIAGRKSVQEGRPDRLADLLDEAADELERLQGVEE